MNYKKTQSFKSFINSKYYCSKHTNYFKVYDDLFSSYKNKEITFVDIGVFSGDSNLNQSCKTLTVRYASADRAMCKVWFIEKRWRWCEDFVFNESSWKKMGKMWLGFVDWIRQTWAERILLVLNLVDTDGGSICIEEFLLQIAGGIAQWELKFK